MRYLDASIPVCTIIGEPKEKVEACEEIMERIEKGREVVKTTTFTVAEIIHILTREHLDSKRILDSVKGFLGCHGLRVSDARKDLCLPALELALKYKVDFVDAHHWLTMKLYRITEIYSLDPHFDRLPGIKRLETPK